MTSAERSDTVGARRVSNTLLRKAGSDLRAARTLAQDPDRFDGAIGFHAQQTVEKALKAVLASFAADYPRTPDIAALIAKLAKHGVCPPDLVAEAAWLSRWGMRSCYEHPDTALDRGRAIQAAAAAFEWASVLVSGEEPERAGAASVPRADALLLPPGRNRMANGDPMPDVVAAVRRSRGCQG